MTLSDTLREFNRGILRARIAYNDDTRPPARGHRPAVRCQGGCGRRTEAKGGVCLECRQEKK